MSTSEDAQIVSLLKTPGRENEGMEALVRRYGDRVYWQIRHLVLVHEDAEELTQDTFVKAFLRIRSWRGEGSLAAWLLRIAVREALQALRRGRKLPSGRDVTTLDDVRDLPESQIEVGEKASVLMANALLKLPPRQRAVFTLRYFDDLDYADVAAALGITENNARASYHYAKEKIESYVRENC